MNLSEISTVDKGLSLQQQFHLDMTKRARGGIVIFLAIWFLTALWVNIIEDHPYIFYLNTLLLVIAASLRIVHYHLINKAKPYNTTRNYFSLVGLILFNAAHWGVMSSWVIYGSHYSTLQTPYMIILSALAIGGTSVLSISRIVSILYPILVFAPALIAGTIIKGTDNLILIILAIIAVIYVLEAARTSRADYWQAVYSRKESDDRALLLEKSSITEPLTSLYNRMYFNRCYASEWQFCTERQQPLSVIMIDLDHFKKINDTYGHFAGDECLKRVARVLKKELKRSTDIVARYGGEEFIVLLPDIALTSAITIADDLVQAISEISFNWSGEIIEVTCSAGVASTQPDATTNNQTLLIAADDAMYKAKASGRNQYSVAPPLK